MPRLARTVCARVPHHVTQRGNRREEVFFTDDDRETYLAWLKDYADQHAVDILAYCLMTNHVHLIVVPSNEDGLQPCRAGPTRHNKVKKIVNMGRDLLSG